MIKKEIIDLVVSRTKVAQRDLIGRDILLHRLLIELSSNKYFFENYAFKGGTCLMKCYLNYYRFSEDLDFTYINQEEFEKKSGKQIRNIMSKKINLILKILGGISAKIGFDFKTIKSNNRYVELGASNKQTTFKLWYIPEGSSDETFIKIQINFLEKIEYSIVEKEADNVFFGKYKDFQSAFLLPEDSEWLLKIPRLRCYNIKEILIEKVRAILTRKGTKARDYIDIYMIEKKEKLDVRNFKKQIIEKVRAVIKFEKYKTNLGKKQEASFTFNRVEERAILLIPLPDDFDAFFNRFKIFLQELIKEI